MCKLEIHFVHFLTETKRLKSIEDLYVRDELLCRIGECLISSYVRNVEWVLVKKGRNGLSNYIS